MNLVFDSFTELLPSKTSFDVKGKMSRQQADEWKLELQENNEEKGDPVKCRRSLGGRLYSVGRSAKGRELYVLEDDFKQFNLGLELHWLAKRGC